MIVADTNTIAYLYLPTKYTEDSEKLLTTEPDWAAPTLWRSELRNILALYLRQGLIELDAACKIQSEAEDLIGENAFDIDSFSVLSLAHQSGCSAYDCEFVSLAQALGSKLITADKKLLQAFPEIAMTAPDYISINLEIK